MQFCWHESTNSISSDLLPGDPVGRFTASNPGNPLEGLICRMPWYKFTIKLRDGSVHSGIRQLAAVDLDYVWRAYEKKTKDYYKNKLASFDVIQLSKLSTEVKHFLTSQGKKDTLEWGTATPTANRKKGYEEGKPLENRKSPH